MRYFLALSFLVLCCGLTRAQPHYRTQHAYVYNQSYVPSVRIGVDCEIAVFETYQYLFPGADARFIPLTNIKVIQNPVGVVPAGPPVVTDPSRGQPLSGPVAIQQAQIWPQAPSFTPAYPLGTHYQGPVLRRNLARR